MALKLGTIFGGSTAAVAGTAGAVSMMMAAAVGVMVMRGGQEAETPPDPSLPAVETAPPAVDAPVASGPEPEPAPDVDTALPVPPQFDLVRVEGDGSAIIAGRSSASARVSLRLDGELLEEVTADGSGSFVAMLSLAPSDTPRVLSLEAALAGSDPVPGRETVVIAPFGMAPPEDTLVAAVEPDPAPEMDVARPGDPTRTSALPGDVGTGDAQPEAEAVARLPEMTPGDVPEPVTEPAAAPDRDAEADADTDPATDSAPAAPSIFIASDDGVRVLQSAGAAPSAQTEVRLDSISYDTAGAVTLSGRAPAETELRVLLDNEPIQLGEVGPGGAWSLDLPQVDPGTYTLSVEQLTETGTVAARIDTPFRREDPERIAASPMLVEAGASVITVQPGFTLWGIAQANFGDGVLYVSIFEENRDQIRDPDLIFPGQIFEMPDLPRE
jgi:nucleoid-associated protein YgaU